VVVSGGSVIGGSSLVITGSVAYVSSASKQTITPYAQHHYSKTLPAKRSNVFLPCL